MKSRAPHILGLLFVSALACDAFIEDATAPTPPPGAAPTTGAPAPDPVPDPTAGGAPGMGTVPPAGNPPPAPAGGGAPPPGPPVTPPPTPPTPTPGGGGTPAPGGGPTPPCAVAAAPVVSAELQMVLALRCQACHSSPPLMGVPGSLFTFADFMRPAVSDPKRTTAEVAVARVTAAPPLRMPPSPLDPLTASETEILRKWVESATAAPAPCTPPGTPNPGTPTPGGPAPGTPTPGGPAPGTPAPMPPPNPFAAAAKCTSGRNGTTSGSALMEPGRACVSCHITNRADDDVLIAKDGEGGGEGGRGRGGEGGGEGGGGGAPRLALAGTVFPSAHEPNRCEGSAAQGAKVVVLDAAGRTHTATVNAAGNYFLLASSTTLTPPLKAKVVFQGRERAMIGAVPTGDCNACHTQNGTTTVSGGLKAPGRILLP